MTDTPPRDDDSPETGRTLAGLRLSALVEIVLFLAVALAVDHGLFGGQRFWHATPHPFWLLVLAVTFQYGAREGLVAALAASAALLVGNVPAQSLDQDLFQYGYALAERPALWLLAAVSLGLIRDRERRRAGRLAARLAEARQQADSLTEAYRHQTAAREKLEEQVAGQIRTVVTLYEAGQGLDSLDPDRIADGAVPLIERILAPRAFSLFLLGSEGLGAAVTRGWPADAPWADHLPPDAPLYRAVIGGQKRLCIADANDAAVLGDQGVLAGPLITPEGAVIGMLKIERLDFYALSPATLDNFQVVCAWIAAALDRARRHQADALHGTGGPLYSAGFLDRQVRFVSALARRLGFPVALLTVRITGRADLDADQGAAIAAELRAAIDAQLRTTDLGFEADRQSGDFVLLLPNTPAADARLVEDRLRAALEPRLAAIGPDLGLAVTVRQIVGESP